MNEQPGSSTSSSPANTNLGGSSVIPPQSDVLNGERQSAVDAWKEQHEAGQPPEGFEIVLNEALENGGHVIVFRVDGGEEQTFSWSPDTPVTPSEALEFAVSSLA